MTSTEKLIWAAAFVEALELGQDRSPNIGYCTELAWSAVEFFRTCRPPTVEWSGEDSGACAMVTELLSEPR